MHVEKAVKYEPHCRGPRSTSSGSAGIELLRWTTFTISCLTNCCAKSTRPRVRCGSMPAAGTARSLPAWCVRATSFMESTSRQTASLTRARGLASATFAKADLTNLEDPDGKWQYILCWGVLMHIPDVEAAVAELARVLAPAGVLVVGEGNSGSWQARAQALYNRLRRPEVLKATPAGMEYWTQTSAGPLLSRSANVAWLVRQFHRHRVELKQLRAGGFAYKPGLPAFLSSALLVFNRFYFKHVRWAAPAASNFLVLHKR